MRYSKIYIPTVKDAMQETEALNYRLLHKAGYIRKDSPGYYSFLPLGRRMMNNLINLVGSHLEKLDCFEVHLPHLVQRGDFCKHIFDNRTSLKEQPVGGWYIREAASEGIRPRLGLLQPKSWEMIEGFKLLDSMESLKEEFESMAAVFRSLLESLNIDFMEADQLSNDCIGELDRVYFLPYAKGADRIAHCKRCGIMRTAESMKCMAADKKEEPKELKLEYTPQVKTITDVGEFLKSDITGIVKTLIYNADGKLYGVLLRGDRELSEAKLKEVLKCRSLRPANEEEVLEATGAEIGFAGPIGLKAEIICDYEAASARNVIVGANKTDYHYVNAVFGRDFRADIIADVRSFSQGDICPECGKDVDIIQGFTLGKVTKSNHINAEGIYALGCELNLYRLLAAIVEKNNDEEGLVLPRLLAPFDIIVMAVHSDNEEQRDAAEQIYNTLKALNYNVLIDDRKDRIGVKFKDSELIGIPLRITVGRKISQGIVEIKYRTKAMEEIHLDDLIEYIEDNEVRHAEKS